MWGDCRREIETLPGLGNPWIGKPVLLVWHVVEWWLLEERMQQTLQAHSLGLHKIPNYLLTWSGAGIFPVPWEENWQEKKKKEYKGVWCRWEGVRNQNDALLAWVVATGRVSVYHHGGKEAFPGVQCGDPNKSQEEKLSGKRLIHLTVSPHGTSVNTQTPWMVSRDSSTKTPSYRYTFTRLGPHRHRDGFAPLHIGKPPRLRL